MPAGRGGSWPHVEGAGWGAQGWGGAGANPAAVEWSVRKTAGSRTAAVGAARWLDDGVTGCGIPIRVPVQAYTAKQGG